LYLDGIRITELFDSIYLNIKSLHQSTNHEQQQYAGLSLEWQNVDEIINDTPSGKKVFEPHGSVNNIYTVKDSHNQVE
jgi:NAD-dependent SIR2 family protein deacetylase